MDFVGYLYIYLYDHPSGDKEVEGKGGKGGRSIDRSFNRTERQRSGNGSATDRIIQFECSCSYSMD